jgi:hypothetical protein
VHAVRTGSWGRRTVVGVRPASGDSSERCHQRHGARRELPPWTVRFPHSPDARTDSVLFRRTAVVIVGREVVPRYYSRSAVRHPHENRAALLIRSDGCVAWALPTGLITGLTVVSDSLGTKLASDKRCNPSGGY